MFILHVFVIKLEDFSVKCVDKDKLHLVEGEIYDETNFPAAFLHGGSEVRWWRERCLQVKRVVDVAGWCEGGGNKPRTP